MDALPGGQDPRGRSSGAGKPGIMATMLLQLPQKMKTQHPEVTDKEYWEGNRLAGASLLGGLERHAGINEKLDADPWAWYRNKINGEIEAEMGPRSRTPKCATNAVQSMASWRTPCTTRSRTSEGNIKETGPGGGPSPHLGPSVGGLHPIFRHVEKHAGQRHRIQEYFVVAGYELNGKAQKFDPKKPLKRNRWVCPPPGERFMEHGALRIPSQGCSWKPCDPHEGHPGTTRDRRPAHQTGRIKNSRRFKPLQNDDLRHVQRNLPGAPAGLFRAF